MKQPPTFLDSQVVNDVKSSAMTSGSDYKCIVTLFYFGGMDTHNVLIPTGSNSNLSIYESYRVTDVRIEQDEITDVLDDNANLSVNADGTWALHPNLTFLKELWDDGDIAFIHDVGTLTEPTTKANYQSNADRYQPTGVFSHNIQQALLQSVSGHNEPTDTGWFGRIANLYDPYFNSEGEGPIFNPDQTISSMSFTISGTDLQSVPYDDVASVNFFPTILNTSPTKDGHTQTQADNIVISLRHDDNTIDVGSNSILSSCVEIYNDSVVEQNAAYDSIFTWEDDSSLSGADVTRINTIFSSAKNNAPTNASFVDVAKKIAQIIYSSKSDGYNQRRQTVMAGLGGWDHHNSLRDRMDPMLTTVNLTIEALVKFLKDPSVNMFDSVTLLHGSDFGRTLSSNNTSGTDHAWAAPTFVIGGAINGGIYPTNYSPNYDPSGLKSDGSSLGRYIPEVAVEQVYSEVLEWFGVPRKHMHLVLPALPLFTGADNTGYIFANKPQNKNYSLNFI